MRAASRWLLSVVGTVLVVLAVGDPPVRATQQPRTSPEPSRPTTRQAPARPAPPPIQLERRVPQRPPQPGPQRPDAGGVAQDPRTTRPRPDDQLPNPGRVQPSPGGTSDGPSTGQTRRGGSTTDPGRGRGPRTEAATTSGARSRDREGRAVALKEGPPANPRGERGNVRVDRDGPRASDTREPRRHRLDIRLDA